MLLLSEAIQGQDADMRGFSWWGWASHFQTYLPPNASQPDVMSNFGYCGRDNPLNPPCTTPASGTMPITYAARSRHPGGVQTAFCDGSVHFISDDISLDLWRALSTTQGSEVIDVGGF